MSFLFLIVFYFQINDNKNIHLECETFFLILNDVYKIHIATVHCILVKN